jgi:hypothetical protein
VTPIPTADSTIAPASSLPARVIGVLFTPRATYADVAAHPRWLGVFLTVLLIMGSAAVAFLSTDIGRDAVVDQQISQAEAYGRHLTEAQIEQIEKFAPYSTYVAPVFQLLFLGGGGLVIAGLAFAVFNAILGGDASFKQVYAVVCHSAVILAALSLFTTPLSYARESLSSATSLAVFLPFLDESSFLARLLGAIDLVFIWWILSLASGLGFLYRTRTAPIATTMFAVYMVIGLIIAAIKTASTGV